MIIEEFDEQALRKSIRHQGRVPKEMVLELAVDMLKIAIFYKVETEMFYDLRCGSLIYRLRDLALQQRNNDDTSDVFTGYSAEDSVTGAGAEDSVTGAGAEGKERILPYSPIDLYPEGVGEKHWSTAIGNIARGYKKYFMNCEFAKAS